MLAPDQSLQSDTHRRLVLPPRFTLSSSAASAVAASPTALAANLRSELGAAEAELNLLNNVLAYTAGLPSAAGRSAVLFEALAIAPRPSAGREALARKCALLRGAAVARTGATLLADAAALRRAAAAGRVGGEVIAALARQQWRVLGGAAANALARCGLQPPWEAAPTGPASASLPAGILCPYVLCLPPAYARAACHPAAGSCARVHVTPRMLAPLLIAGGECSVAPPPGHVDHALCVNATVWCVADNEPATDSDTAGCIVDVFSGDDVCCEAGDEPPAAALARAACARYARAVLSELAVAALIADAMRPSAEGEAVVAAKVASTGDSTFSSFPPVGGGGKGKRARGDGAGGGLGDTGSATLPQHPSGAAALRVLPEGVGVDVLTRGGVLVRVGVSLVARFPAVLRETPSTSSLAGQVASSVARSLGALARAGPLTRGAVATLVACIRE